MAKTTKKQSTVPVKTEKTEMSTQGKAAFNRHTMGKNDFLIPKILVMQPGSEAVLNGDGKFGELRDTLDMKILGGMGKNLEVQPFHTDSGWILQEIKDDDTRKFIGILPSEGNEDLAFEETIDGKVIHRTYFINIYCLLPREIVTKTEMPYILSFRSTSLKAGKKIVTLMYMRNQRAGRDPWATVIDISVSKVQNDKGTFAVLDATQKRAANVSEMRAACHWYDSIAKGHGKVDNLDVENVKAETTADSKNF